MVHLEYIITLGIYVSRNLSVEKRSENFLKKAQALFGNRFDYSKVVYTKAIEKVCIICNKCKTEFYQQPNNHLTGFNGCGNCALDKRVSKRTHTKEDFITACNNVHNNKYDYSLTNYVKWNVKVDILCPYHGLFTQEANSHKQGTGCPTCSKYKTSRKGGMSNIKDLDNELVSIYLYEFKNDKYHFIKVGLTSRDPVYKRFSGKRYSIYDKKELFSFKLRAIDAIKLETYCLESFKDKKYFINKEDSFKGCSELFKLKYQNEILKFLKENVKALCIDSDAS